jgi:hypothetical protein
MNNFVCENKTKCVFGFEGHCTGDAYSYYTHCEQRFNFGHHQRGLPSDIKLSEGDESVFIANIKTWAIKDEYRVCINNEV